MSSVFDEDKKEKTGFEALWDFGPNYLGSEFEERFKQLKNFLDSQKAGGHKKDDVYLIKRKIREKNERIEELYTQILEIQEEIKFLSFVLEKLE